jgi:hypothetical protein
LTAVRVVKGGAATPAAVKIKGSLASCSVSGVGGMFPPLVSSGTFSRTLAAASNDCAAVLGLEPLTGTLTFKWKADPTTPLAEVEHVDHDGDRRQRFTGGLGGVLGSPLSDNVITSEDIDAFFNGCASSKGVRTLHIGIGTLRLP